jgi:hypothetical protein
MISIVVDQCSLYGECTKRKQLQIEENVHDDCRRSPDHSASISDAHSPSIFPDFVEFLSRPASRKQPPTARSLSVRFPLAPRVHKHAL